MRTTTDWPVRLFTTLTFVPKEGAVGGGQIIRAEGFAARCLASMKARAVPGGATALNDLSGGAGRFSLRMEAEMKAEPAMNKLASASVTLR